jgi:geranylgeranyl diphosphate synthase type II
MRYSLLAGGKRIRPVLALATARASGREPETVCRSPPRSSSSTRTRSSTTTSRRWTTTTCAAAAERVIAVRRGRGHPGRGRLYAEAFRLVLARAGGRPAAVLDAVASWRRPPGVDGMVGGQYIDVRELVTGRA